jgi:predicted nucleic acid-binding protein
MIALDTTILVYAHRQDLTFHAAASETLTKLGNGLAPWAIPWQRVHELIMLV